jgi:hypothetical protein
MGTDDYNITPPTGHWRLSRTELFQWLGRLIDEARPARTRQRRREREIHDTRWREVVAARGRGLRWLDAYGAAADALSGTEAAGGTDAMSASYKIIQRQRRVG